MFQQMSNFFSRSFSFCNLLVLLLNSILPARSQSYTDGPVYFSRLDEGRLAWVVDDTELPWSGSFKYLSSTKERTALLTVADSSTGIHLGECSTTSFDGWETFGWTLRMNSLLCTVSSTNSSRVHFSPTASPRSFSVRIQGDRGPRCMSDFVIQGHHPTGCPPKLSPKSFSALHLECGCPSAQRPPGSPTTVTFMPAPHPSALHPCATHLCANGGRCYVNQEGNAACECADGFAGFRCESDVCSSVPCGNGGKCTARGTIASCICPPHTTGLLCESVICTPKCENGGVCELRDNSPICSCPEGFTGVNCNVIDPCIGDAACALFGPEAKCLMEELSLLTPSARLINASYECKCPQKNGDPEWIDCINLHTTPPTFMPRTSSLPPPTFSPSPATTHSSIIPTSSPQPDSSHEIHITLPPHIPTLPPTTTFELLPARSPSWMTLPSSTSTTTTTTGLPPVATTVNSAFAVNARPGTAPSGQIWPGTSLSAASSSPVPPPARNSFIAPDRPQQPIRAFPTPAPMEISTEEKKEFELLHSTTTIPEQERWIDSFTTTEETTVTGATETTVPPSSFNSHTLPPQLPSITNSPPNLQTTTEAAETTTEEEEEEDEDNETSIPFIFSLETTTEQPTQSSTTEEEREETSTVSEEDTSAVTNDYTTKPSTEASIEETTTESITEEAATTPPLTWEISHIGGGEDPFQLETSTVAPEVIPTTEPEQTTVSSESSTAESEEETTTYLEETTTHRNHPFDSSFGGRETQDIEEENLPKNELPNYWLTTTEYPPDNNINNHVELAGPSPTDTIIPDPNLPGEQSEIGTDRRESSTAANWLVAVISIAVLGAVLLTAALFVFRYIRQSRKLHGKYNPAREEHALSTAYSMPMTTVSKEERLI